ncbi:MAG: hypothetical protein AAFN77_06120 [Planctomycetota bacterium]
MSDSSPTHRGELPCQDQPPFPLAMSSIERFHWFDDEPDYPNVVYARIEFDVRINIEVAKKAWEIATAPHPFANIEARHKQGSIRSVWQWHSPGVNKPLDEWEHSKFVVLSSEATRNWSIQDLQCQSRSGCYVGLHVADPSEPARSEIRFVTHHAIADGLACLKGINDWLVIYNNLISQREPREGIRSVDPQLIRQRNQLGLLRWSYLKHLPFQAIALFGAAKFIFRRTASLKPNREADVKSKDRHEQPDTTTYPQIVSTWIDEPTTSRVYGLAQQLDINANAVLLGLWFETLGHFRKSKTSDQGHDSDRAFKDWIRVILPMSIRSHADRRLPVTNRTAIVQIDRQPPNAEEREHFFRMLFREINIIRGYQLEKMFLIMIRLFSWSDRLLKKMAQNSNSRGLSVFTDLGRPFLFAHKRLSRQKKKCESIIPVDFELVGPIRRGTPLNLSVSRFQGKLKLVLHYDRHVVSANDATELLEMLQQRLNEATATN